MSSGIFISYRRTGGLDTARDLHNRLTALNYKVFFDKTSMREGKFNQQIHKEIEDAADFILILSEGALDRCVEEEDWMRFEIQRALSLHKNIIPIWKPSFKGFPLSLPEDIADIKLYDSVVLSEDYYDAFFREVIKRLQSQRTGNTDNKSSSVVFPGQESLFITFDEWLDKKRSFRVLLRIRRLCATVMGCVGISSIITGCVDGFALFYFWGTIFSLCSVSFLFLASNLSQMKKKYASVIFEVELNKDTFKRIRSSIGEMGLIEVGYDKINVLVLCEYHSIQRIDNANFVLETYEGKSLFNCKRKKIVGKGPYETIKKTEYKIECIGNNGIQIFSLDGYQRYD